MSAVGGLVLDTGGELRFVSAEFAMSVMADAQVVLVPGLEPPAVGLTLADDRAVAAMQVGSWPTVEVVVCSVDGIGVALVGAKVVASGLFERADGDAVLWNERRAAALDLRQLLLRAEAAIWEARAVRDDGRRT